MLQKKFIDPQKLVCIFAHPDDEAFGAGGAIAYFAGKIQVEVICVTNGDFPRNKKIGEVRKKELLESAKILGVKKVHFLGFHDGELSLKNYHEVASKVEKILKDVKPDTILTFDQNGVSGHLDHVAVSFVSSYLFERLNFLKNIYYFCEKRGVKKIVGKKYFVYFPEGYSKDEVDWILDVTPFYKIKIKAMKAHVSQRKDFLFLTTFFKKYLKEEYFKIQSK